MFLHCTTGTTRGPTLYILYLSLFVRHEKWEDPEELERYVKQHYYLTNANLDMVERVLDEHSEVQEANLKRWLEEEDKKKRALSDAEKAKLAKIAQDEAELARLLALAKAEAEKIRQ